MNKTLLKSLSKYLQINLLANKIIQSLKAAETSEKRSQYFNWTHMKALHNKILQKHHNNLLAEHLITDWIYMQVCKKYWWLKMKKQIKDYCLFCQICLKAQMIHRKSVRQLQLLKYFTQLWDIITMNFITDLSESRVYKDIYDVILNVIDKFLKMCHYISYWKNMTAEDFMKIFIQKIIHLHEILTAIMLNQRSLFTSWIWINMMYTLKIKWQLNTVFHS